MELDEGQTGLYGVPGNYFELFKSLLNSRLQDFKNINLDFGAEVDIN